MEAERDIITPAQAAEILQMHEKTIMRLARGKKLPGKKIGGQWRFSRRRLTDFIESAGKKAAVA